jgi:uncharacterized protein (TIGR02598 family)
MSHPTTRTPRRAFTLAEILLATATIVICVLTMTALMVSLLRSSRKSVDASAAVLAADQILTKVVYEAQENNHDNFWDTPNHTPYVPSGTWTMNKTEFTYTLDATEVVNTAAVAVGASLANNRLKLVNVRLTWWDGNSGSRAGYGKLTTQVSRIVREEQKP